MNNDMGRITPQTDSRRGFEDHWPAYCENGKCTGTVIYRVRTPDELYLCRSCGEAALYRTLPRQDRDLLRSEDM